MIAGAMALTATVAWGQSAQHEPKAFHDGVQHHGQQSVNDGESRAAMLKMDMMHAAAADADLKALVDDMNMFVGEMKIDLMARVLTLLVERQSALREQMTAMHQSMMRMMAPMEHLSVEGPSGGVTTDEVEPGSMCGETP
jgi:hypothetical protein